MVGESGEYSEMTLGGTRTSTVAKSAASVVKTPYTIRCIFWFLKHSGPCVKERGQKQSGL